MLSMASLAVLCVYPLSLSLSLKRQPQFYVPFRNCVGLKTKKMKQDIQLGTTVVEKIKEKKTKSRV